MRTYFKVEWRTGMNNHAATYLVQIVDESDWVIPLKIWYSLCILLSIEYIADFVAKVR